MSDLPTLSRPYRSSAVLHAILALVILVVAAISGGGTVRALLVAAAYFLVATGWTWLRLRQRESRAETHHHPSSNGRAHP